MGDFILNIVHRPEMVPEYAEKVTGHGKVENITRSSLLNESLDIFKLQQEIAHKNNLKTTIQMTYASLFCEEAVELAKLHHQKYGDEIGLTLLGLACAQFREKYQTKDFCIWMFSKEDKISIVNDVFTLFKEKFGFYPQSTGSYYLDIDVIKYIKTTYPEVKCAVATCWEEGPKAYHTCNNSWYTFLDGGPWNPWIPSIYNTHVPASCREEDSGIVAIPHLSRDLLACFDGNGSNFGTHPQNVLRGMIYKDGQYPYLFNLIDQYRHLQKYNHGYSYNMMFVGPGWMNKAGRWEAPYELLVKSYEDAMRYYGELKKNGQLIDMTMSEFADYYRRTHTYSQPECALWNDILYGGDKQLFWYSDPALRTCLDMNQGGAIIDLRPYIAKLYIPIGIGHKNTVNASYPYLIQANYRAGYFTHYAGEGTLRSAKVIYQGQEVDLALCRTKAHFSEEKGTRILTLDPVTVDFTDLNVKIQTIISFAPNSGEIKYERKILEMSHPSRIVIQEYVVATYGTTEYPEDMSEVLLKVVNKDDEKEIKYNYKCRTIELKKGVAAKGIISPIKTMISLISKEETHVFAKEGYAFSPMLTLGIEKELQEKEALVTWLKLEKAN